MKNIDAKGYVCQECNALFSPKKVTNPLSSAWWIDKNNVAREVEGRRAVRCDCGSTQLVPKINSVIEYLNIVEDIISFHLLNSPWVEIYLTEGKVESPVNTWGIQIR